MPTRTRRERIAALAATADYNPNEAANAQAMLDRMPEVRLDAIAADIHAQWGKGIEVEFEVGRLLSEAATELDPNARNYQAGVAGAAKGSPFGDWLRAQKFPFSASTAYNLRIGYERKDEVLAYIEARSQSSARGMGVNTAVAQMTKKPKPGQVAKLLGTAPTSAFATWLAASDALADAMSQVPDDELVKVAEMLQRLVARYQEVKASR